MHQKPREVRLKLSPQAGKYARRDAPREARLLAARGALPLPPIEVATVLFALLHDPDPEVKDCARGSLEEMPAAMLEQVLEGDIHPALLAHLAQHFRENEGYLERIALNPRDAHPTSGRATAPHPPASGCVQPHPTSAHRRCTLSRRSPTPRGAAVRVAHTLRAAAA